MVRVALVACLLVAASCRSDADESPVKEAGVPLRPESASDVPGAEDTASEAPASEPSANDPTGEAHTAPSPCADGTFVTAVAGHVIDEARLPTQDVKVQLCIREALTERLLCLQPRSTDSEGRFEITVPSTAQCMARAAVRVILPRSSKATVYCHVPFEDSRDGVMRLRTPVVLYDVQPATFVPELGDENMARQVTFDAALDVEVVPSRYYGQGSKPYEAFASRWLTGNEASLCFANDSDKLEGVYAFAPEGDIADQGFRLRLANRTGLRSGTRVALYALGGLQCTQDDGSHIEEGEWHQIGEGVVDSAARFIDTEARLPCFTWLGYAVASSR